MSTAALETPPPTTGVVPKTTQKDHTVPLNWKEVWYTNCPVVSASNVDEALGWTREEFAKIGVKYAYFRSVRENVKEWAAPKFLEKAAKELLEEQWKKVTTAKLPDATELLKSSQRFG
jgi:hypothetical protein